MYYMVIEFYYCNPFSSRWKAAPNQIEKERDRDDRKAMESPAGRLGRESGLCSVRVGCAYSSYTKGLFAASSTRLVSSGAIGARSLLAHETHENQL